MQGTPQDASKLIIHREFKEKEIDLYIEAFIQIAMIGIDIIKENKKHKNKVNGQNRKRRNLNSKRSIL